MDTNDDLIMEILLHLPVESLLRFRSVCKSWCGIIDSSAFRKFHLQSQSRNNINDDDEILFLQIGWDSRTRTWELISTLFMDNWKLGKAFPPSFHEFLKVNLWSELVVVGPINGLLCIYDKSPRKSTSIAICNPCLGELKILPVSPACSSGFDYAYSGRILGFGFDSLKKDHKVVQIIQSRDESCYVELYSGRTNTWKVLVTDIIEDICRTNMAYPRIKTTYKRSGVVAYWYVVCNTESIILSFDMQSEVFEMIKLPQVEKNRVRDLLAKDDDLLVLLVDAAGKSALEVWELDCTAKERAWVHVRNVDLRPFLNARTVALWKYGVVLRKYVWDEGKIHNKCLIFYDYNTEKEIKRVELPIFMYCGELLVDYKCTFNSLENA